MFSETRWAALLHPTLNANRRPDTLKAQSNVQCHFKCQDDAGRNTGHCGFEWTDKLSNVTRKMGNPCPHCRDLKPVFCGSNSCILCVERSVVGSKLAKYKWIVDRNRDAAGQPVNPLTVSSGSNVRAWFTCPSCSKPWLKPPNDLSFRADQVCLTCYTAKRLSPGEVLSDTDSDVKMLNTTQQTVSGGSVDTEADSKVIGTNTEAKPPPAKPQPVTRTRAVAPLQIHSDLVEWLVPLLSVHVGVGRVDRSEWNGGLQLLVFTKRDQQFHPVMLSSVSTQTGKPGAYKVQNTGILQKQSEVRRLDHVSEERDHDIVPLYHPDQVRFAVNTARTVFVVARLKDMGDPGQPFTTALSFTPVRTNHSSKRLWYRDPDRVFAGTEAAVDRLVEELIGSRVMTHQELSLCIQPSLRQEVLQYWRFQEACQRLGLSCQREFKQHLTVDAWVNRHSVQLKVIGKSVDGCIRVHVDKRAGFNHDSEGKTTTPMFAPYTEGDFEALVVECEELPGRFCVLPMSVLVEQGKVSSARLGLKGTTTFRILLPTTENEADWATPWWDQLTWFGK